MSIFGKFEDFDDDGFEITDDGIEKLKKFKDGDITDEYEDVIIDGVEDEEELQDSYLGQLILQCPICKTLIIKSHDAIDIDKENNVVDEGKQCPYCYSSDGLKILGVVASLEDSDSEDEHKEETETEVKETEKIEEEISRDDIDADADDKKETANKKAEKEIDDADADRDYKLKKNGLRENASIRAKLKKAGFKVDEDSSKNLKESVIVDKVTIETKEPGFITKLHDLRRKGYKTIGTGEGKIILGLYDDVEVAETEDEKIFVNESKKLNEEPIYGLNPQYDARKSFGGKAQVDVHGDTETLYSYDTPVAEIKGENVTLFPKWDFSQTALRHVKEFLKQHGFRAESRNQIASDYPTKMNEKCENESIKESDAQATISIDDAQKWVDYDMKRYGRISAKTNRLVRKAGFQIIKDQYGDYEVAAGKYNESLKEDFKDVTVTTEDTHMEMTSDENGKVTVTTEPVHNSHEDSEVISPLSDEQALKITQDDEDIETEEDASIDVDIDDFDESSFDELGESYLKRVYENVSAYKTTSGKLTPKSLILEGVINFNSGKKAKTKFVFEGVSITKRGKVKFIGENKNISNNKKAFTITGSIKNKNLITESLTYNYRGRDERTGKIQKVYGTVKK